MKKPQAIGILATLLMLWPNGAAFAERAKAEVAGVVTRLDGEWSLVLPDGSSREVRLLDAVPDGASLKSNDKKAVVEVELVDRTRQVRKGGSKKTEPIVFKKNSPDFWAEAIRIFSGKPQVFVTTSARSREVVTDTVLHKQNGKLDLSPALVGMNGGKLNLEFARMKDAQEREPSKKLEVAWEKSTGAVIDAAEIDDGIYVLSISRGPAVLTGWVLILNNERFESIEKDWNEVLKQTKAMSKNASNAHAREGILKALMFSLAVKSGVATSSSGS